MPRTHSLRLPRWLAALLLGLGLAPAVTDAAPANLLKNPGFEQPLGAHPWMPAGWDTARAGLTSVFYGRDTLGAHSGSFSVSVANASGLIPLSPNWSQPLLVGPEFWGKDVVFSAWTRTLGLEGRAYIKVDAYRDTIGKMALVWKVSREDAGKKLQINVIDDPILDLGWKREFFSDAETGWVKREVRMYVPPTVNMIYARCGILGTGQVMVDDASLTLEPTAPPAEPAPQANLIADPGFEGDGNAWEYSLPPYAEMRADRDTTTAHNGKASMLLSSPPVGMIPGRAGVSQVIDARAIAGKHVKFTGYIKCEGLKREAFLSIFCHGPSGVRQDVSVATYSGTTDWSPASVEIDVPADASELWAWFSYTAPSPGRVWFDDASLVVTGKATAAKP